MLLWLVKRIRESCRSWLTRDRIRTSATQRAWLEIKPPAVTFWQGEQIQVQSRQEQITAEGAAIVFECLTRRGRETLIVRPGDLHQPPICEWSTRNQTQIDRV